MNLNEEVKTRILNQLNKEGFQVSARLSGDGSHADVQWKNHRPLRIRVQAREVSAGGNPARFRVCLPERREGFFFVFCSEALDKMWLMSADEFEREAECTCINFCKKQRLISGKYEVRNFARLKGEK